MRKLNADELLQDSITTHASTSLFPEFMHFESAGGGGGHDLIVFMLANQEKYYMR